MNWQERIDQETRSQQDEAQRKREEAARELRLVAEQRVQTAERMFGLLETLNVRQKLEEIKRDVWKDGKVEEFERSRFALKDLSEYLKKPHFPHWNVDSVSSDSKVKGFLLRYDFQWPRIGSDSVTKLKFGHYEELHHYGGLESTLREKKIGFHREIVDSKYFVEGWEDCCVELSVGIVHLVPLYGERPSSFLLWLEGTSIDEVRGTIYKDSSLRSTGQFLNPENLNKSELKNLIDNFLLQEGMARIRVRKLPSQINEEIAKMTAGMPVRDMGKRR